MQRYTDPEIAHVGLYEADAESLNAPVDVFRVDFNENDRSLCDGDTVGFVKIFVERATDKIVGATICGSHAGDMISGAAGWAVVDGVVCCNTLFFVQRSRLPSIKALGCHLWPVSFIRIRRNKMLFVVVVICTIAPNSRQP